MPDLIITDINGQSELLTDYKSIKRKRRVNGEYSLSFLLLETERNQHAFPLVQEESIVECDGQEYRIKDVKKRMVGNKVVKQVRADHVLFDLIDHYVYGVMENTNSITEYLDFILNGSDYTYQVIDAFDTEDLGKFGNDNALSLLQEILDTFGAEVDPNNKTLRIYNRIGVDSHFQFRYKHNLKTVDYSVNSDNLSTYIKGYGKQNDDGTYVVETDYTSPNTNIFGTRHAKPFSDGRYTTVDGLKERLERELNDVPEVSITVTFAELKRAGFPFEVIGIGDTGYLIHEPMGLDLSARVIDYEEDLLEVEESKVTIANFKNNITDIVSDFKKVQKTVDKVIDKDTVRYNALDEAVKRATEALNNSLTELEYPVGKGIVARDPNNPNKYVAFTSTGLGITVDGGQTFKEALTADGLVASAGVVGYFEANHIQVGPQSLFATGYDPTDKIGEGQEYNGVKIDAAAGLIVASTKNKVTLNATKGLEILKGSTPVFSLNSSTGDMSVTGNITMTGGSISWSDVNKPTYSQMTKLTSTGVYTGTVEANQINATSLSAISATLGNVSSGTVDEDLYIGSFGAKLDTSLEGTSNIKRFRFNVDASNYLAIDENNSAHFYMGSSPAFSFFFVESFNHRFVRFGTIGLKGLNGSITQLQVRDRFDTDDAPISASDFVPASRRDYKKNIEVYNEDALNEVMNTTVYKYHRMNDDDLELKRVGLLYEESPADIVDPSGKGISSYSMISLLWKAVQELKQEIDLLKGETV